MPEQRDDIGEWVTDVVQGVVEQAFAPIAVVRQALLQCLAAGDDPPRRSALAPLREPIVDLLSAPDAFQLGLGVIVAPEVLADEELFLEWWQQEDGRAPRRLEFDLNRSSIGFYDYLAAEWFATPRRTGRRHVTGPYVDVHGTDRYVLTLTEPVEVDGRFVGVAGADVTAVRLEQLVLRELGDLRADVVVTTGEGRVVLSSSGRWLVGSLLTRAPTRARVRDLPGLSWRVAVRPHA